MNNFFKNMSFYLILFFNFFMLSFLNTVNAAPVACPVCAVAIAGGLGISRFLGVDDSVIGVWLGAGLLALSQWTVYFFEKKNIKNIFVKILCYACWYGMIIPLYLGDNPSIMFNLTTILGIDSFLLSIIAGTLTLFIGVMIYRKMKEKNGGHAHFPFEKVVLPIVSLFVVSFIFYLITKA